MNILFFGTTRKISALRAAFSRSCGGLQPSAAMLGPSGPAKKVENTFGKFCRNTFGKFAEIC